MDSPATGCIVDAEQFALDNWQHITIAQTPQIARQRYVVAGMSRVVIAMLTACSMSLVDTFIIPFTYRLGPNLSSEHIHFISVALLTITAAVTILM
ncbi:hypothetical protein [Yoonia sp. 1_MG-2023]|uniref:hypothetical protein n=1 Tax=Yoonia sp. 1_MG-2023 TaxID=3062659 RepID=UPI0011BDF141|nr:hypothetical protein [Yoonia sp. 1_MG-2023]MDO6590328.1 hypothetical protein [Yoonia sp. 1_MG-2023]